jgi:hypothetical protein
MKFQVRTPFAIHLQWVEIIEMPDGSKRKQVREQSFFSHPSNQQKGDVFELSAENAIAHMHKLEPMDEDAKKLFGEYHDEQEKARAARQATDGNTKSMEERIASSVVAALVAAGVVSAKKGAAAST